MNNVEKKAKSVDSFKGELQDAGSEVKNQAAAADRSGGAW